MRLSETPTLPDLQSGDLLKSCTGHEFIIIRTAHKDEFGEAVLKIKHFKSGTMSGYPTTRDRLQMQGCIMVKTAKEQKEENKNDG